MDRPGDQFLAGTGLAEDQHVDIRTGDLLDGFEHPPHALTGADDFFKGIWAFDLPAQQLVFGIEPPSGQHPLGTVQKVVGRRRPGEIVGEPP